MYSKEGKGSGHENSDPCCGRTSVCPWVNRSVPCSFSAKRLTTVFLRGFTKKNILEMGSCAVSTRALLPHQSSLGSLSVSLLPVVVGVHGPPTQRKGLD